MTSSGAAPTGYRGAADKREEIAALHDGYPALGDGILTAKATALKTGAGTHFRRNGVREDGNRLIILAGKAGRGRLELK